MYLLIGESGRTLPLSSPEEIALAASRLRMFSRDAAHTAEWLTAGMALLASSPLSSVAFDTQTFRCSVIK